MKYGIYDTKTYLGDGVYAQFDGEYLWLTTENGYTETNRIGLDFGVLASLTSYVKKITQTGERNEEQD